MIVGQLMLGVLAGLGAVVASLLSGQPLWKALLLYVATSVLVFLGSVVIVALRGSARAAAVRPSGDRPLQPVPAKR